MVMVHIKMHAIIARAHDDRKCNDESKHMAVDAASIGVALWAVIFYYFILLSEQLGCLKR